ncbi:hypothetical protein S83_024493, partial [Arachis hypogaea]
EGSWFHIREKPLDAKDGGDVLVERDECRGKGGAPGFKVAILGAAGAIGQSLSLL